MSVNCALLDKQLLYVQLFGARRGSYTGAVSDISGLVAAADGGTLFLDELSEMPLDVQAALLRFLDTHGEYIRLGDTRPSRCSVQIVGATNTPLDDPACRAGRFRDDLWYRMAVTVLRVPPLKHRREDLLAYLSRCTLPGSDLPVIEGLSQDALQRILEDEWPGNFRELENFVQRLPAGRPGGHSAELCQRLLLEGRGSPAVPPAPCPQMAATQRSAAARRRLQAAQDGGPAPCNRSLDWQQIIDGALNAFLQDHGEDQAGWPQLHRFIEQYMKPCYIGHYASLPGIKTEESEINYSALARSLSVADGKTAKAHMVRFDTRFGRSG